MQRQSSKNIVRPDKWSQIEPMVTFSFFICSSSGESVLSDFFRRGAFLSSDCREQSKVAYSPSGCGLDLPSTSLFLISSRAGHRSILKVLSHSDSLNEKSFLLILNKLSKPTSASRPVCSLDLNVESDGSLSPTASFNFLFKLVAKAGGLGLGLETFSELLASSLSVSIMSYTLLISKSIAFKCQSTHLRLEISSLLFLRSRFRIRFSIITFCRKGLRFLSPLSLSSIIKLRTL